MRYITKIVEDKELYDGSTRGGEAGEPKYPGDIYEDSGKEPPKRFAQNT